MALLQDLPPELLQYIFSFISELNSLSLLTTVCKGFRTNAEPSLYHTFDIPQDRGDRVTFRFIRTLLERPPLGKHVKRISLGFWPWPLSDQQQNEGWTKEDHVDFEKIVTTFAASGHKVWTTGRPNGRKRSANDSTQYILLVVLLSLVPELQAPRFAGTYGLSLPYCLIQKVAKVSWANSYSALSWGEPWGLPYVDDGRLPMAQAQAFFDRSPITTLAVSQLTDTVSAHRLDLISLGTAVTNMKLDGAFLTKQGLEELIGFPLTLKSFSYVSIMKTDRVSPRAIVDILYRHHAQSLKSLTVDFHDGCVGWQDDTNRLYRSTCLHNFTNLTHLQVQHHMLLRVQLDIKRYVFPSPFLLFSISSKVDCSKPISEQLQRSGTKREGVGIC